jgi:hypothetical protein
VQSVVDYSSTDYFRRFNKLIKYLSYQIKNFCCKFVCNWKSLTIFPLEYKNYSGSKCTLRLIINYRSQFVTVLFLFLSPSVFREVYKARFVDFFVKSCCNNFSPKQILDWTCLNVSKIFLLTFFSSKKNITVRNSKYPIVQFIFEMSLCTDTLGRRLVAQTSHECDNDAYIAHVTYLIKSHTV